MINAEKLNEVGIDYQAGLSRFMDNLELYEAVLNAFLSDNISERAQDAYENRDYETLYSVIHGVKGSSGNAGLTKLYIETSNFAALLHSKNFTEDEVIEHYNRFERAYTKTYDGIKSALQ